MTKENLRRSAVASAPSSSNPIKKQKLVGADHEKSLSLAHSATNTKIKTESEWMAEDMAQNIKIECVSREGSEDESENGEEEYGDAVKSEEICVNAEKGPRNGDESSLRSFVDKMRHCYELHNKKGGSCKTFDKAVQAKMIPRFTGTDNGASAVWEGAFRVSRVDKNSFDMLARVFAHERFRDVALYREGACAIATALKNDQSMVREFFDGLLASSQKITTTGLTKVIREGLRVTPARSTTTEALRLAIKRASEADQRWLFGPKGETGVCEGIQSYPASLGALATFGAVKIEATASALDKLRIIAGSCIDRQDTAVRAIHTHHHFISIFRDQEDTLANVEWAKFFLANGGIVIVIVDCLSLHFELLAELHEVSTIYTCSLRPSSKTHSVQAIMFASRQAIGNVVSAFPSPTTVKENIANLGITDFDQCFVLTFFRQ